MLVVGSSTSSHLNCAILSSSTFKLVNVREINAFALPGGPM